VCLLPVRAAAQSADTAAPAAETTDSQAPVGRPPAPSFISSLTVFGIGDAYLVANSNRPPGGDNLLRNFDTRSGEVRLNYVELAVERKASGEHAIGFRADLGLGPTAKLVGSPEPGPDSLKYLQQAYVSVRAPLGSGLTIDAGKFVTPAGAEVIETQDNWNYSRSLLFAWAIPYYHAGVRASYAFNDKVSATGFVLNGWNNVKDNNSSKSLAAQVLLTPMPHVSIAGTWIGGAEQRDAEGRRDLIDAIVTVTVSPRIRIQLNADVVRDRGLGPGVGWHGVSAALRGQLSPNWVVSPRLEWFADPQGASTGVAQNVTEATMTVQRAIGGGLMARAEYRVDRSTARFFTRDDGSTSRLQQTFGVALFYGWASK
jgi:hypothetical protein